MLEVIEAGGIATLQDAGRRGWRRFGVPLAGPMDRFAFEAANLLAGNPSGATVVEVGAGDLALRARYDCLISVTGAGYELSVGTWTFPLWGSYFVRGGWLVWLTKRGFGTWAYLAAAGGFEAAPVLGSRSTYLRGHFGGLAGRALQPGDVLASASAPHDLMENAGRSLASQTLPAYRDHPAIEVIPGPQADRFSDADLSDFFSGVYRIDAASDRMGYRLDGPPLRSAGAELTSEGMAAGTIQVPPGGQPIAMMADCATTGGYAKIACVTSAAMPLLAQCTPGKDEVRFQKTTVEAAQTSYRSIMERLRHGIIEG